MIRAKRLVSVITPSRRVSNCMKHNTMPRVGRHAVSYAYDARKGSRACGALRGVCWKGWADGRAEMLTSSAAPPGCSGLGALDHHGVLKLLLVAHSFNQPPD